MWRRILRQFSTKVKPKNLRLESISPKVIRAEYAVRGDVVLKSMEMEAKLKDGVKYPFTEIIPCNIGNPQSLGQNPLTFVREVLSLIVNPKLLTLPGISQIYASDVIERAQILLNGTTGGVGAYTMSQGLPVVRNSIAKFIEKRDEMGEVDPNNIYLTSGASGAVEFLFKIIISSEKDGVLVPIPQYPLYNALIALQGGSDVGYYINSSKGHWEVSIKEMEKALEASKLKGIRTRCLVVINPGNPTGQVLRKENMRQVIEFCDEHDLMLIADEVYQHNIYTDSTQFHSFKKVSQEMNSPIEIASLNSISKGYHGECGLRGGYMELHNFETQVKDQILKLASISLCSNSVAQCAMELMVNPPQPGSPSYDTYTAEKNAIMGALKRKSQLIHKLLNEMVNVQCNFVEGAMYAFPEVKFSAKAIREAKKKNMPVDKFYVFRALEETGIVLVPGSGFGQRPDTYHFRITTLVQEDKLIDLLNRFKAFNDNFHNLYS
ncbi:unnamed protein product [Blepharisma stoltei]|uniref:Aminotransferase class I/classII large domain-containing protein n=1 Tax=Blepharisma stoltei TaxID=1481888 RepID=A0AAU9J2A8_9CILI|nr:unnamed protein product [Blepharisma stoltei]